ncbi:MAG: type VI secretion system contractile sheath large subunit [Gallionellaceae bacterium]|nr:type VI secretion system contractile sheath large subunit [Gallionellaceae bacterium]
MRILVLADLHGNGQRDVPLALRRPLAIHVDNAEQVLVRLAPRLSLSIETPGEAVEPIALEFRQIDDFHPDSLFRQAEAFVGLRGLREELTSPATFARAAAALGLPPADGSAADANPAASPAESNADMIERLLGRAPSQPSTRNPDLVDKLLHEAVAPHVVPDHSAAQAQAITVLDMLIADRMRRILRQPAFQHLEAAWRGVWKLATELETGAALQISLLDISQEELAADLQSHAGDLSASALHRVLNGPDTEADEETPWSLLVGDFTFGPDDAAMLAALGALAGRAGAPFLAGASPALAGYADLQEPGSPAQWPPLPGEAGATWQALRQSPLAAWIGLALPRLLARLPYGAATDPVESFAFEEMAGDRRHEHYLWGNPAYALAFLAGQAFSEEGWEMDVAARLMIEDLPSHVYRDEDGEPKQQACAEVWLSEAVAEAILDRGVMPILSYRNRNAARLLRWQSVAMPPKALAGIMAG